MKTTLVILFALILAISVVSALNDCQDSQTILKIAASQNAHVETPSGSLYSLRLCYNEIFGKSYSASNPHACTGSNLVAKLSQQTNAHIEGPGSTLYNTQICYGDLSCTLRSGLCNSNEQQLLSIAQQTNAHASLGSTFQYKLCCSSPFALSTLTPTTPTTPTTPITPTTPGTTTPPSTTSPSTNLAGFIIHNPLPGAAYNDSILINISMGTATQVNYSIDSLPFVSYTGPIIINLSQGPHSITVRASNATAFNQTTITFNIVNSTLITPTTPTTPGGGTSGGSGTGGGSSSSSGGTSSRGVRTGISAIEQPQTISDADEEDPIVLKSDPEKAIKINYKSLQSLLIILILIAFIVIAQVLINRHKELRE